MITYTIRHNTSKNGVEVAFPAKPPDEVIEYLKMQCGLRWGHYAKVWYAKYSESLFNKVKNYLEQFTGQAPVEPGEQTGAEGETATQDVSQSVNENEPGLRNGKWYLEPDTKLYRSYYFLEFLKKNAFEITKTTPYFDGMTDNWNYITTVESVGNLISVLRGNAGTLMCKMKNSNTDYSYFNYTEGGDRYYRTVWDFKCDNIEYIEPQILLQIGLSKYKKILGSDDKFPADAIKKDKYNEGEKVVFALRATNYIVNGIIKRIIHDDRYDIYIDDGENNTYDSYVVLSEIRAYDGLYHPERLIQFDSFVNINYKPSDVYFRDDKKKISIHAAFIAKHIFEGFPNQILYKEEKMRKAKANKRSWEIGLQALLSDANFFMKAYLEWEKRNVEYSRTIIMETEDQQATRMANWEVLLEKTPEVARSERTKDVWHNLDLIKDKFISIYPMFVPFSKPVYGSRDSSVQIQFRIKDEYMILGETPKSPADTGKRPNALICDAWITISKHSWGAKKDGKNPLTINVNLQYRLLSGYTNYANLFPIQSRIHTSAKGFAYDDLDTALTSIEDTKPDVMKWMNGYYTGLRLLLDEWNAANSAYKRAGKPFSEKTTDVPIESAPKSEPDVTPEPLPEPSMPEPALHDQKDKEIAAAKAKASIAILRLKAKSGNWNKYEDGGNINKTTSNLSLPKLFDAIPVLQSVFGTYESSLKFDSSDKCLIGKPKPDYMLKKPEYIKKYKDNKNVLGDYNDIVYKSLIAKKYLNAIIQGYMTALNAATILQQAGISQNKNEDSAEIYEMKLYYHLVMMVEAVRINGSKEDNPLLNDYEPISVLNYSLKEIKILLLAEIHNTGAAISKKISDVWDSYRNEIIARHKQSNSNVSLMELFNIALGLNLCHSKQLYSGTNRTCASKLVEQFIEECPVVDKGSMKEGGIAGMCPEGTKVQTILMSRNKFTLNKAKGWLKKHDYKASVDTKKNYFRFRQVEPAEFEKDSFRTIAFTDGIKAVIGCPVKSKMGEGGVMDIKEKYSTYKISDLVENILNKNNITYKKTNAQTFSIYIETPQQKIRISDHSANSVRIDDISKFLYSGYYTKKEIDIELQQIITNEINFQKQEIIQQPWHWDVNIDEIVAKVNKENDEYKLKQHTAEWIKDQEEAEKRYLHLQELKKRAKQYAEGGNAGCDDGCKVKGKLHSEGGEKFRLKNSDKVVELEEGEAVIKRAAVKDPAKKHVFNGKKMSNKEILNEINTQAGGNPI
jgi:hypothetical protein